MFEEEQVFCTVRHAANDSFHNWDTTKKLRLQARAVRAACAAERELLLLAFLIFLLFFFLFCWH